MRIDIRNATSAIENTIHASTIAAVIASRSIIGLSSSPSNGIRFPINRERVLSFIFPEKATIKNHTAMNSNGKGTTYPVGGIHLVLSLFSSFPLSHVLIVGMQASPTPFDS